MKVKRERGREGGKKRKKIEEGKGGRNGVEGRKGGVEGRKRKKMPVVFSGVFSCLPCSQHKWAVSP